ncbi:hypothetical protein G1H11_21365 [Phytoactinopolyspora alkaliphila]|uniref:Uncharacterized protein n=1 Tax=Phytoactinopolyspora alkaliphila TaxID=1783498 RepID=A0A6N9YS40_9ACTN|nr:beta-L-arabinofuranosidase domain-containing protein [Phytoactinopolyspora alkaliphila]NED97851.1 hypothetical protein [Phytoactinopolyspora alkaliphila]
MNQQVTVRLNGILGEHLAAAVAQLSMDTPYSERLVVQDVVRDPESPRLFEDYAGDLSGRYIDACGVAFELGLPFDTEKAQRILTTVLNTQNPDGSFGRPGAAGMLDHGRAWGHGRLLAGLLRAAAWSGERNAHRLRDAVPALVRWFAYSADDWVEWLADPVNQRRKFLLDCYSCVLPLVEYYRQSGDETALRTAGRLAAALPDRLEGVHMHGYLLALRGMLELGVETGNAELSEYVLRAADRVATGFLLPHGGVLESTTTPWDINTEGCGIADWAMLCARLAELGRGPRHATRYEQALFNALLHAQHTSGHFGCETRNPDATMLHADYAPQAWWCCTFHGVAAIGYVASRAAVVTSDAVDIALPVSFRQVVDLGDHTIDVEVTSAYPDSGPVDVRVSSTGDLPTILRLRLPRTSVLRQVLRDGETVATRFDGDRVVVDLPDGKATVRFELEAALSFEGRGSRTFLPMANSTEPDIDLTEGPWAVYLGPRLLAASSTTNDLEDLLRIRALQISLHDGIVQAEDGRWRATAWGYDTFRTDVTLEPLATTDRGRNDAATRISFPILVTSPQSVHDPHEQHPHEH